MDPLHRLTLRARDALRSLHATDPVDRAHVGGKSPCENGVGQGSERTRQQDDHVRHGRRHQRSFTSISPSCCRDEGGRGELGADGDSANPGRGVDGRIAELCPVLRSLFRLRSEMDTEQPSFR